MEKRPGLSGNALKLIAMAAMTCDHVGLQLLPGIPALRAVGRLAMPIFAYMIAEGCRYTRNRKEYLLRLLGLGAVCQTVYLMAEGSWYMSILITFSLSVGLIYLLDWGKKRGDWVGLSAALAGIGAAVFLCEGLPRVLSGSDFSIDYGIWGVLAPVLAYFGRPKLAWFGLGLVLLALNYGGNQWLGLCALPLLLLYNGQRGRLKIGGFFYLYYPLHLAMIYGISLLLR